MNFLQNCCSYWRPTGGFLISVHKITSRYKPCRYNDLFMPLQIMSMLLLPYSIIKLVHETTSLFQYKFCPCNNLLKLSPFCLIFHKHLRLNSDYWHSPDKTRPDQTRPNQINEPEKVHKSCCFSSHKNIWEGPAIYH